MDVNSLTKRRFSLLIIGLSLLYFLTELFIISQSKIGFDDFWFAHNSYHYQFGLPYKDFSPYKTVFGYYLLLIPLTLSHGIVHTLEFTKQCIAFLNTSILLVSSFWLSRYFSRSAILFSLLLIFSSKIGLIYSLDIRVDLFGYWLGFFAFLLLLENRFLWAGIFLGLGFGFTQKVLWYIFGCNCALGLYWLLLERNKQSFNHICIFNVSCLFTILLYLTFWSSLAGFHAVFNNVFIEAAAMYHLEWYYFLRKSFWISILYTNTAIFLLFPLSLFSLVVRPSKDLQYHRRFLIILFNVSLLICLINYKQIFPYYMVVMIPPFFLLYTSHIDWVKNIFLQDSPIQFTISNKLIQLFLMIYTLFIIGLIYYFNLNPAYFLLITIPCIYYFYFKKYDILALSQRKDYLTIILSAIFFTGVFYSLSFLFLHEMSYTGDYQKTNLTIINELLEKEGGDYFAGEELIYNKTQAIPGLRHLMMPAVMYLYQPNENTKTVMTSALYEDPNATVDSVINYIKDSNVKFFVNSYRIENLPQSIRDYLNSQYEHLWGSIYFYAPIVGYYQTHFNLKFSGVYLIQAKSLTEININGKNYSPNTFVSLAAGENTVDANSNFRLKLIPEKILPRLNSAYTRERKNLFSAD